MELKFLKEVVCLSSFCFLSLAIGAQENPPPESPKPFSYKVAGVPSGFQFLLEKQTTAIDVFFGGVYLTTTLATYSPTTIEFHDPSELVSQLSNLLTPEQVAQGLTGDIDSHAGEVCVRNTDTDCGVLTPDSVGVIFDEGRFRADIFINPNLLSVQQYIYNRFLPLSESDFSHINNLGFALSGGSEGSDQIGLSTQTLLSYRQQRVVSNWGYSDNGSESQFNMSNLYWQMDRKDFQYQAGWFDSENRFLSFTPSLNLLGFRYSTSFKARTDIDFSSALPLEVFLTSRSIVNLYKDGRLVSSSFYSAGNQQLDTSNLPDGAYNIEIRVTDISGRQEAPITRFFVKSQRLAPNDQDLYFLEIGDVHTYSSTMSFPESENIPLVQAGYSHRLTADMGLNIGAAATDEEALAETGIYYVSDTFDFEPKVMATSSGDYGWSLGGYGHIGEWFGSYQFRRVWSDNHLDSEFHLINGAMKQHMMSISHELLAGYAQLRYSVSRQGLEDTSESVGLSYTRPFTVGNNQLSFTADLTKTDSDTMVLFGVSTSWYRNKVRHFLSGDIRREDSDLAGIRNYQRLGYSGSWLDEEWRPEDINFQWHAEADKDLASLGVQSEIQNYLGSARFGVDFNKTDLGDGYIYSGELATSVAGESSVVGIGGKNGALGALIIEVASDEKSSDAYDVFINNAKYGEIKSNQKVVVPVAAYKTYNVRLQDKGNNYVSFSDDERSITIYPGNVKALNWKARSLGILIGRVVYKLPGCFDDNAPNCWAPLVYAKARGVNDFSATDSEGYIQVEVFKADKSFSLVKKGRECKVDFSEAEFTENLAYIEDDIKCYEVDSTQGSVIQ